MKKMQCEACGSIDIKKVDDTIFECQSCGVQYSKEEAKKLLVEIKGEVKIDHSAEVENAIKRADQFYKKGDTKKAEQYYNKALDLDPENTYAIEKLNNLRDNEEDIVNDVFVFEKNIDSKEGIFRFLYSLGNQSEIVKDIYKEIDIVSTTEKYYKIIFLSGKFSGSYSGTACYEKKVAYTDYESSYEPTSSGVYKTVKVPVTKYRTEVDKKPSSGKFSKEASGYYVISDELYSLLSSTKKVEFSIKNKRHETLIKSNYNEGIISKLEYYLLCEGVDKNLTTFNSKFLKDEGDSKFSYKGVKIDFSENKKTTNRATDDFKFLVDLSCKSEVKKLVQGDYSEGINYDYKTDSMNEYSIYMPFQIIKYKYKGQTYVAVLVLNDSVNIISMTYPMFKSSEVVAKDSEMLELNYQKSEAIPLWVMGAIVSGLIALISSTFGGALFVLTLAVSLGCIIKAILTAQKNSQIDLQIENAQRAKQEALAKIYSLQKNVFRDTSKAFFAEYKNSQSCAKARQAASQASDYSTNIAEVIAFGSEFSKMRSYNLKDTKTTDGKDNSTSTFFVELVNQVSEETLVHQDVDSFSDVESYLDELMNNRSNDDELVLFVTDENDNTCTIELHDKVVPSFDYNGTFVNYVNDDEIKFLLKEFCKGTDLISLSQFEWEGDLAPKKPGKVFVCIERRYNIGAAVKVTINGREQGIIKSKEYISIDIDKDCTIDCKWNSAFTKVSFNAYVGQTKIVYLDYGMFNLTVDEAATSGDTDAFLHSRGYKKTN